MILTSFEYKEFGWELNDLAPLKPVNLFVGRNATGKTRSIRAIQDVTSFLQMGQSAHSFETVMKFSSKEDKTWSMEYSFKVNVFKIEKESLIVNGEQLIKRSKTTARYKDVKLSPPPEKLIVQIRRDRNLYPDIERLIQWAEGVTMVTCSDINCPLGHSLNPYSFCDLVDSLSEVEKKKVLSQAKKLGYNISDIKTIDAARNCQFVQVKERFVPHLITDMDLSNGMYRTLYLLCFLSFIKQETNLSLLLIDDLGEGLDYSRSVDFGKMIFDDCKEYGLQLIASSNDAFLMDVVDIANWQVLNRKNGKVTAINSENNPDLFRKFRMTGLSNFDFFSSDFIDSYLNEQKK